MGGFSWPSPRALGVNKSDRAAAAARSCFPPLPSACHLQRQRGLRSRPLRWKARNGNGDGSVRRTQTSTTLRRRPRLSGSDSEQTQRVTFEAGHGERCLREQAWAEASTPTIHSESIYPSEPALPGERGSCWSAELTCCTSICCPDDL